MNRKRIVIVGGGLAGLSAAEALIREHRDRFDVTIVESKRVTGGRAGSFEDSQSAASVDYCQHVAMGCCTNFVALMDRCGLAHQWKRYSDLLFLHPDFPKSTFAPSTWLPAPLHLATTISSLKFLTWRQQRCVRRGLVKLMRTPTKRLVGLTAEQWLRSAGQDTATIRDFWDVILVSALGESTDQVAMSAARKVMMDGFAAAHGASDILVPTDSLQKLIGQRLTDAISQQGVAIETSCHVEEILNHPISVHATSCCLPADHIVAAVPWHQTSRLLTAPAVQSAVANLDKLSDIPTSPITGVHLWFDREITPEPHAVLVGTLSQWLFRNPIAEQDDQTDEHGEEHYYQVVISASSETKQMNKEELIEQITSELQRLFPATSHAKLLRSVVVTNPQSVFSVRPDVEAIRPPARTALPWLHLAGDWISTGWPATMEGAVISGIMAANSVLQSEGLPAIPISTGLPRGFLARMLIAD